MILGMGVDLMEVPRIESQRKEDGEDFGLTVFTRNEREYCEGQWYPSQHYAARFAVKEAVFKAFTLREGEGVSWNEVELCSEPEGVRNVVLYGKMRELAEIRGVKKIYVSLSHTRTLAMASVILEG